MGREVWGRINRNPLSTCWSLARAQIVAKASAQRTHTHHRVCEHFASNFYHRLAHVHRPSIVHPHPDSRPHASTNTYTHTHTPLRHSTGDLPSRTHIICIRSRINTPHFRPAGFTIIIVIISATCRPAIRPSASVMELLYLFAMSGPA